MMDTKPQQVALAGHLAAPRERGWGRRSSLTACDGLQDGNAVHAAERCRFNQLFQ